MKNNILALLALVLSGFFLSGCKDSGGNSTSPHSFAVQSSTPASLPASSAEIVLEIKGDVFFTGRLLRSNGERYLGVESINGEGNVTKVLKVPDNTNPGEVSYRIEISTSEEVPVAAYTFDYIQAAAAVVPGPEPPVPGPVDEGTVVTAAASSVDVHAAVLNGSFKGFASAPRELGFEWGTDADDLDRILQSEDVAYEGEGAFSAALDVLEGGITYYFRAYVILWQDGKAVYRYGEVLSFVTEEEPDTPSPQPGQVNQPGWFELPVMNIASSGNYKVNSEDADQYYAWHMCAGGEKGPDGKTARNFTVCYSARYHCALWVAAPRHAVLYENHNVKRQDNYHYDELIPSSIQCYGSGDSGCNRGHMLGSEERTCSRETNSQVFAWSNIAPQLSNFNTGGGGWNLLEDFISEQVCSDTLYVIIGTVFDEITDGYGTTVSPRTIKYGGRDDVGFPTAFYYIAIRTKSGRSGKSLKNCTSNEIKCAAFLRAHTNSYVGKEVSSAEMMSVSDLEKITGFTYFANLPNAPKDTYSPSDWGL